MADPGPDYGVEIQKLRVQQISLQGNMERYKLELLEIASRKRQAFVNIESTEAAIADVKKKLVSLVKTHGEPDIPSV